MVVVREPSAFRSTSRQPTHGVRALGIGGALGEGRELQLISTTENVS